KGKADTPRPSTAVHLAGSLPEAPDQQHVSVITEQLPRGDAYIGEFDRIGFALDRHVAPSARPRSAAARICPEHGDKSASLQPRPVQILRSKQNNGGL